MGFQTETCKCKFVLEPCQLSCGRRDTHKGCLSRGSRFHCISQQWRETPPEMVESIGRDFSSLCGRSEREKSSVFSDSLNIMKPSRLILFMIKICSQSHVFSWYRTRFLSLNPCSETYMTCGNWDVCYPLTNCVANKTTLLLISAFSAFMGFFFWLSFLCIF